MDMPDMSFRVFARVHFVYHRLQVNGLKSGFAVL
jgi:hypothetical protein